MKGAILLVMMGMCSCTKWNYHDGGLSNGVHDCSMWEYLHTQSRDWDSTIIMIEHAGLRDLFEGNGEHEQITFLGLTNYSIRTYLWDNGHKRVTDLSSEQCKQILSKLIIPKRIMLDDVPRGSRRADTGVKSGGIIYPLLNGGEVFMWTYRDAYMNVADMGAVSLFCMVHGAVESAQIVSTDIQTNNGVVQALGYNFRISNL